MNPLSHLFISWSIANTVETCRRDRALITAAGLIPDIDGIGIIVEIVTRDAEHPIRWWSQYHHVFGHNLGFALFVCGVTVFFARWRKWAGFLAFLAFHLHLFCDIIGARGPDGYQWPIPYLLPFSDQWQLVWQGQWALNAWPNFIITIVAIGLALFLAWKRGYSFLELFSRKADTILVRTLHDRFGLPG